MTLSEACIRRPVMTTLITASLIVFGAFAYRLLAGRRACRRSTSPPSRSPRRCRARARRPWRRRSPRRSSGNCRPSPASRSMTSSSSLGTTRITIQFELNRNIDGAALDVQTALSVAAAPAADRDDHAALLPEGQSGRLSGSLLQPEFADAAVVGGQRLCRAGAGAADFTAAGRRSGAGVRGAAVRGARPGRSGGRRPAQHFARRRPQRASPRPTRIRRWERWSGRGRTSPSPRPGR